MGGDERLGEPVAAESLSQKNVFLGKQPAEWKKGTKPSAHILEGVCYFSGETDLHTTGIMQIYSHLLTGDQVDPISYNSIDFTHDAVRINVKPKGPHKEYVLEEKDSGLHQQVAQRLTGLGIPKDRISFARGKPEFGGL